MFAASRSRRLATSRALPSRHLRREAARAREQRRNRVGDQSATPSLVVALGSFARCSHSVANSTPVRCASLAHRRVNGHPRMMAGLPAGASASSRGQCLASPSTCFLVDSFCTSDQVLQSAGRVETCRTPHGRQCTTEPRTTFCIWSVRRVLVKSAVAPTLRPASCCRVSETR